MVICIAALTIRDQSYNLGQHWCWHIQNLENNGMVEQNTCYVLFLKSLFENSADKLMNVMVHKYCNWRHVNICYNDRLVTFIFDHDWPDMQLLVAFVEQAMTTEILLCGEKWITVRNTIQWVAFGFMKFFIACKSSWWNLFNTIRRKHCIQRGAVE